MEECNRIKVKNNREYKLEAGKWIRNIDDDIIIKTYKECKTLFKTSKILKMDVGRIKTILKKYNISINSHKEALKFAMNNEETKNRCSKSYYKSNNKRKATNLKKYGVEFASQTKEFQEKVKQTSIEKYGKEHFLQSKEIIDKKNKTVKKNYNVDNISQVNEIQEKVKQTNLKKYGVEFSFQDDKVKKNIKKTLVDKYNVENPSYIPSVIQKRKETSIKNFGVDHFMKTDSEPKIKLKNKIKNKYGVDNYFQSEEFLNKQREINLKKLNKILEYLNLKLLDKEIINFNYDHTWKCLKCNTEFITRAYYFQQGFRCKKCFPRNNGISLQEKEIISFIKEILPNIQIIENDRIILKPKELDIYIPSKKIAIEFNGLYWHSEQYKNKNYHMNKTTKCLEQGIQLIHIFEDEWILKRNIVKSRLKQILGVNKSKRIHARKTIIREIKPSTKNKFLEKFHIQGQDKSNIKLGAFHQDELVSVMTFSKGNIAKGSKFIKDTWELNRFCSNSNYHIPGIASKLLTYFKRNYEWKEIFSYADRRWSQGELYYKLGFELEKITDLNYWYVKDFQRIHRFNLRKRPNEPKDIPEWILRESDGYKRIWDCGSLKYQLLKKSYNI